LGPNGEPAQSRSAARLRNGARNTDRHRSAKSQRNVRLDLRTFDPVIGLHAVCGAPYIRQAGMKNH
jgi:hypothetical protein